MKTVKELETELKVSKVSIYSNLKKEEFKSHVFKGEKNVTCVDEVGEELLKAYYLKEKNKTIEDLVSDEIEYIQADSKDSKDIENVDIIRILQEQIAIKDEQINTLLNIVINQQKMESVKLIAQEIESKPEKKSFFQKIFKNK